VDVDRQRPAGAIGRMVDRPGCGNPNLLFAGMESVM
jgi:hypothetical protein